MRNRDSGKESGSPDELVVGMRSGVMHKASAAWLSEIFHISFSTSGFDNSGYKALFWSMYDVISACIFSECLAASIH